MDALHDAFCSLARREQLCNAGSVLLGTRPKYKARLTQPRRAKRRAGLGTGGKMQITHSQPPRSNIFHTAQRHVVGAGKARNFGQPRHFAVIHGQLAKYAAGFKACHTHEVDRGFRVAAPFEHAAGPRPQGEHMTGAAQMGGLGIGRSGGLDGGNAVSGGNTRGNACGRLNGDGKGSSRVLVLWSVIMGRSRRCT